MYKADDISKLVPAFRERVEQLVERLSAQGYKPIVRDALRTHEEAAANAAHGTGIEDSMHCYGVAADLICNDHGWDCAEHGCHFFDVLHTEALDLGLVRVRLTNKKTGQRYWDGPHVQAVPVALQNAVRGMPHDQLDAFVRRVFAGNVG